MMHIDTKRRGKTEKPLNILLCILLTFGSSFMLDVFKNKNQAKANKKMESKEKANLKN